MTQNGTVSPADHPATAVSTDSMAFNHTGSWRFLRPEMTEKLAPCRRRCPAGTDIPRVLGLVAENRISEAWLTILQTNPLPAICGRVCYAPCESECTRAQLDEGLAVQSIERMIGEQALGFEPPESPPRREERVAIVGSGPAGLTCAYFLAASGLDVTVYEAESVPGGMLRVGIPAYRLPRSVLEGEIERIARMGVKFVTGCRIGLDRDLEAIREETDAVFVATGAHRSRRIPIPIDTDPRIMSGLAFLRRLNLAEAPSVGHRVVVIGGGNTALDAARASLRLGAAVTIFYRRGRDQMPAHPSEIEEAKAEGVAFRFLQSPISAHAGPASVDVEFINMELGPLDESGRARPVPVPGSNHVVEADSLIIAVGEQPDLEFYSTAPGIFLGGDAASGSSTVVDAIASGRGAAADILTFLGIDGALRSKKQRAGVAFVKEGLQFAYFPMAPRVQTPILPVRNRLGSFAEVVTTISHDSAVHEATRCISCGVCNACGQCWVYCPDGAILPVEGGYSIDLVYCKGCGICAAECPRDVIRLVEEES
jgi:NADPH-dependent glutamate synthase beta subunit-like oxidoreductase